MGVNALLLDFNKSLNTAAVNFQAIQKMSNNIMNTTNNIINKTNNITNITNNVAKDTKVLIENANIQIHNTFQAMEKISDEVSKVKVPRAKGTKGLSSGFLGKINISGIMDMVKKGMSLTDQFNDSNSKLNRITANPIGLNDPIKSADLRNKVYSAAQRSKSDYGGMLDSVSNLGLADTGTFNNTDEMVAFAELAQKSYKISGGDKQQQQANMTQLTQAMGDGNIGADEYKSITESSPIIAQAMESYTGKTAAQLEEMVAKGAISSDIIKNAMFSAADDIDVKFAGMSGSFEDVWTTITNVATKSGEDTMSKIGNFLKSDRISPIINDISNAVALMVEGLSKVLDVAISVAYFFADHWEVIGPIIYSIVGAIAAYQIAMAALTAVQWLFDLSLSPMLIAAVIIGLIIAAIYLAVNAFNSLTGATCSATGIIIGALAVVGAFIANLFMGMLQKVFVFIELIYNGFIEISNFIANVFKDPIGSIIHLFGDMADNVLNVIEKIAKGLDLVFGTKMANSVSQWRTSLAVQVDAEAKRFGNTTYQEKYKKLDINEMLKSNGIELKHIGYGDAWNKGYSFGEKIDNFDISQLGKDALNFNSSPYVQEDDALNTNVSNIANNTGAMSQSMEISEEDLKYLRDAAELEVINKFTTSSIKVNMTNNNAINNNMDLDGIVSHLENSIYESMSTAAEGVHDV